MLFATNGSALEKYRTTAKKSGGVAVDVVMRIFCSRQRFWRLLCQPTKKRSNKQEYAYTVASNISLAHTDDKLHSQTLWRVITLRSANKATSSSSRSKRLLALRETGCKLYLLVK